MFTYYLFKNNVLETTENWINKKNDIVPYETSHDNRNVFTPVENRLFTVGIPVVPEPV